MPAVAQKGYRLSPQQSRLWLTQQDGFSQIVISLEGRLHPEAVRNALRRVVQQHEILRTIFQDVPGMKVPIQVVTDDCEPDWITVELWDLDQPEQQAAIEKLYSHERELSSNSDQAARVRALLAELGPHKYSLILTLPALCCDTSSLSNLVQHLADAYANEETTEETVQYAQFSEWQNELFDDEQSSGRTWWNEWREATAAKDGVESTVVLPLEGEEGEQVAKRIERRVHDLVSIWCDRVPQRLPVRK